MALIVDDQIDIFALKKTLKEFNSLLKDIRVPNYSMAMTFCIPEDQIPQTAKNMKNQFENEDSIGVFEGTSSADSICIDYPEVTFNSQAVEGLMNQLYRIQSVRAYAPQASMFETQEFVLFKFQLEQKIQSLIAGSKAVKEHRLSPSVSLDEYCKDESGKLSQMGNQFQLNLNINLFQI